MATSKVDGFDLPCAFLGHHLRIHEFDSAREWADITWPLAGAGFDNENGAKVLGVAYWGSRDFRMRGT